jgi:hypothetical protein
MKLFLLSRRNGVGYDEYVAHIIRAEDALQARKMAASIAADEGTETWLSASAVKVRQISADGPAEILLSSFNAG